MLVHNFIYLINIFCASSNLFFQLSFTDGTGITSCWILNALFFFFEVPTGLIALRIKKTEWKIFIMVFPILCVMCNARIRAKHF